MELLLPDGRPPGLALPSYVKLDMAFGVGAGGQLFDKSRYRSHGAINGPTWAAGLHGYSLDFDLAGPDYVLIPAAHTQLDFTTEDFSLVMRVYFDSILTNMRLFTRGLHDVDGIEFYWHTGWGLQMYTSQAPVGQRSRIAPGTVFPATWYTLGFSRAGASVILYQNGVPPAQVAGVHIDPLTSARSAEIGVYDNLIADPFDGHIEFLRIFGGIALTASEHLAWHNALA